MNSIELQSELSQNESDKKLAKAELDASKQKWVEYIMKNKDEICSNTQPLFVRKKRSVQWNEFIKKIKKIFGFELRKENIDGIEAYLQYRDELE